MISESKAGWALLERTARSAELDAATGMYYYGARYYDPRLSIFISVDPLAEKYPNIGSYVYVANNPINFIDPDGREIWIVGSNGVKIQYTSGMLNYRNSSLMYPKSSLEIKSIFVNLTMKRNMYNMEL